MSATDQSYKVVLCSTAAQLKEAHRLRVEVFHKEQGFPFETEVDEYDALSAHFLLMDTQSTSLHPSTAPASTAGEAASTAGPGSGDDDVRGLGTLRWVPYPSSAAPAVVQDAAAGSVSSKLPLGRPPSNEGTLAVTFGAAGGAKLGRLALEKSQRGKGLGKRLVVESEQWVTQALRQKKQQQQQENGSGGGSAVAQSKAVEFRIHSQMHVVDVSIGSVSFFFLAYGSGIALTTHVLDLHSLRAAYHSSTRRESNASFRGPNSCSLLKPPFHPFRLSPPSHRLGYSVQGDQFDEEGAPHLLMVKTITL